MEENLALEGDRARVEVAPYDLEPGRIVYRDG